MSIKPISQGVSLNKILEAERTVAPSVAAPSAAVPKPAENNQGQVKLNREDAQRFAEVMNEVSALLNSHLSFGVHEATDQLYVQIIDIKTKEVIKQIPTEEVLELSAKIQEMVGIILDKYA
jgi:uncharacterized FlaG/YvyC family protein